MTSSKKANKITAIIPFFNEEKHIQSVVSHVLNFVNILILVDDGSTDSSINKIPQSDKIILLTHSHNKGKGTALRTGIEKSKAIDSEITITLDADNQHDPKQIPNFIEKLKEYDFVIGSRVRDKSIMPLERRISNFLTSKLLSLKTGRTIKDSQSGYRAFRTEISKNILPNYSGFEAESEMIVKVCRNNYSLGFLTIPTIYGDDESKMQAIPTILGFIKVLIRS